MLEFVCNIAIIGHHHNYGTIRVQTTLSIHYLNYRYFELNNIKYTLDISPVHHIAPTQYSLSYSHLGQFRVPNQPKHCGDCGEKGSWLPFFLSTYCSSPKKCCMGVTAHSTTCHHPTAVPGTACRAPCPHPWFAPCHPLLLGWRTVEGAQEGQRGWWTRAIPRYHGIANQEQGGPA